MPNAFHKDQLSSGAIATFIDGCQNTLAKHRADLTGFTILYVCSCVADSIRDRSHASMMVPDAKAFP